MIASQDSARMEVMQQIQSGEVGLEQVRDKMLGVHDQESQLNELSYVLTEDELNAFSDYQDAQTNQGVMRFATGGTSPDGSLQNETFFVGTGPDGAPVNGEIRIMSLETDGPDN